MQPTRSSTRNAERHFLINLINASAALESPPVPPIPAGHAREIPFEDLTPFERSTFFGDFERAYADTQFGDAP